MEFSRPKILVVDDEANVLLTVQAILRQEGYDVDAVGDGAEALGVIRERHYDLVLTDLKMPGLDGFAVLNEVRKRSPATVTVVMTGYGSVSSALDAVQAGAYEYLLKPAEVPELKMAVRRALERKRLSEMDTLYRVSRTITSSLDAAAIAGEVGDAVRRVLRLENACLATFDRNQDAQNCPAGLAAALRDGLLLQRLSADEIISSENGLSSAAGGWAADAGVRAFILVPGVVGERLVCVLCADNGPQPYDFHASAQRFLRALASQAALGLANAALVAELRENNRELAAANQKLQELDKLKSQFLSVATHELRTPLSVILGYNSMLAESLEERLDPEEQSTLRESIAACKRLIRLVNSMLDVSQIESGKMRMNYALADIREVVSGVAALFQHEARQKQIHLAVELPARVARLKFDPERIEQVLINLIGNALKFTSAGGSIRVAVRPQAERNGIEVSVSDTGIGIPPEEQQNIFDEFAQVRRPGSRRREGSGLGLAITKRILEAHAAKIEVQSAPGQGSTFSFVLPARPQEQTMGSAFSA
jgi:signal transduction histidine kinase